MYALIQDDTIEGAEEHLGIPDLLAEWKYGCGRGVVATKERCTA
jgi:hypothetical protein